MIQFESFHHGRPGQLDVQEGPDLFCITMEREERSRSMSDGQVDLKLCKLLGKQVMFFQEFTTLLIHWKNVASDHKPFVDVNRRLCLMPLTIHLLLFTSMYVVSTSLKMAVCWKMTYRSLHIMLTSNSCREKYDYRILARNL